jgi:hypothetical protein
MAKDVIHFAVKNALIKDGWEITADPYTIKYKGTKVFADLAAEMPIAAERGGQKIVVEIKSFLGASPIYELEGALGQFRIYLRLLQATEPDRKLYLAISDLVESRFFRRPAIQFIVEQENLSLIVVNTETEEVVKWIN